MTSMFAVLAATLIATNPTPSYLATLSSIQNPEFFGAPRLVVRDGETATFMSGTKGNLITVRLVPSAAAGDKIKLQLYIETATTTGPNETSVRKTTETVLLNRAEPLVVKIPATKTDAELDFNLTLSSVDRL